MTHVLVVGGVCERSGSLDRVAEATCNRFNIERGESVLFRRAIDREDQLRRWSKGSVLVSHSAGILAVYKALYTANADEMPDRYLAFNGPEPTDISELVVSGAIKTVKHTGRILKGPLRKEQIGTLAEGAYELVVHAFGNVIKPLSNISQFSTSRGTVELHERGLEDLTVGIATNDDFWLPTRYDRSTMDAARVKVGEFDGVHDDLLIRPAEVLEEVAA
jgi:hypothetical protein